MVKDRGEAFCGTGLIFLLVSWVLASAVPAGPAQAQQGLRGQEKKLLDLTKSAWVGFRDFGGRQLIYFTHLEVYRCGLKAVRFSLNSDDLDEEWQLQPCDEKNPNAVTTDEPYISMPPGTAQSISVQLTFSDGTKSAIETFRP